MPEFQQYLLTVHLLHAFVFCRAGQDVVMPQPEGDEETGHTIEGDTPGVLDITGDHLKVASQHHEQSLPENGGNAIEGGTDAYEVSLVVLLQSQHIEAVGSNVVGSAREGHQPEEGQRALKPIGRWDGEGHTTECRTDEQLHRYYPPALSLDDVYKRTPKWLDDPRQIEPRGIERDVCVTEPKSFVHDE